MQLGGTSTLVLPRNQVGVQNWEWKEFDCCSAVSLAQARITEAGRSLGADVFAHRVVIMSGLCACTYGTSGDVLVSAVGLITPGTGRGMGGIARGVTASKAVG